MANTNQYDAGRNIQIDRQHRLSKLQEAQQITWINLGAYSSIMVAELIIGYLAQISVLIADGLNNLTGVCGAAILITGLKFPNAHPIPTTSWGIGNTKILRRYCQPRLCLQLVSRFL